MLKKLTNTKTVIGIVSSVVLILTTLGVQVDNEAIMTVVKAICSIGILLGVMNDTGMTTNKWNE
jgi:uncharacterized membrane protein